MRAAALSPDRRNAWPLAAAVGAAGVLALLVARLDALVALGLLVAIGGTLALFAAPMAALVLAVVILYTNLPAGAVEYGLIPSEAAALVGALFVPAVTHHLLVRRRRLRVDRTFALMIALLGVMLVSGLLAIDAPLALTYIGTYAAEGLAVYLLVVNAVRDRDTLLRVLAAIVGASVLLAVLSLYQEITGNYEQQFLGLAQRATEGSAVRSRGPTDDANRYAQILLVAGSFALAFVWTTQGRRRALALAALGIILAGVVLTYSRGGFLALALLLLLLGALHAVPPRRLAIVAVVGALLVPALVPGYADRVRSIAGAVGLVSEETTADPDGATRGRTTSMLAATLAFTEHPVLGVGPAHYAPHYSVNYVQRPEVAFRQITEPRRAHNLYLELAAELGIVGLLVFLAIPALLLRELWLIRRMADAASRPRMQRLATGFIVALAAYLANGMFLHLSFHRYYWLLIGLTAAAVWIWREELSVELEDAAPRTMAEG